ncbi:MATE family efflux transporter [Terrisporobacter sp.]
MDRKSIFETKSISQLIVLFSFPTICSLVLESLTSMVDTAFAGHLGNISDKALTAMGIISPILLILIAAQLIFGVSTSIVISKRLGENNQEKINQTFEVGFYSCFIFSFMISLFIFLFEDSLLLLLGAKGEVFNLAKEYLNIAVIFNIFSSVGYMLINIIRAFGYPKIEVMVGVLSTIINMVFNVVFTFVLNMGMKGIALSTLISEIFYFGFSTIFLVKKKLWFNKSHMNFNESKDILISIVKIGFVQFLMQSLNSVSAFIINKVLILYGSVSYVGAWSICSNMNMVILLPLIGLTQGVQSIVAYFHSSQNKTKERTVKSKVLQYSLIYSITVTVMVFIFASNVLKIFTNDINLLKASIPIMRIVVAGFPFLGLLYAIITFMQVSGREDDATKLELMRQIVLSMPLVIILPKIFLRYDIFSISPQLSVFLAVPLSTILLLIIYFRKIKNILKE